MRRAALVSTFYVVSGMTWAKRIEVAHSIPRTEANAIVCGAL